MQNESAAFHHAWSRASAVSDSEVTLRAEAGLIYFLLMDASMLTDEFTSIGTTIIPIIRFDGGIRLVDWDVAISNMTHCGLIEKYPGAALSISPK